MTTMTVFEATIVFVPDSCISKTSLSIKVSASVVTRFANNPTSLTEVHKHELSLVFRVG